MRDPNGERMPEVSKRVGENSGLGKNHSRALKKIVSEAHTGPGIIPVPSGQSGKSHGSVGSRLSAKDTASGVGTTNPRLKTGLVQPKKAARASLERINLFPRNFCVF